MIRQTRTFALTLALAVVPAASSLAQSHRVPEPSGLWQGPLHSTTPATLQGATVLDSRRMVELVKSEHPAMIDVSNLDVRPPGMRPDAVWSPVHRTVPNASWMPGAGQGTDDAAFADQFAVQAAKLTGGDKSKPIVTFCHPNRWGSWNAGKRLVALGYRHVYWFPGGSEGWDQAGQRLAETKPTDVFKLRTSDKTAETNARP